MVPLGFKTERELEFEDEEKYLWWTIDPSPVEECANEEPIDWAILGSSSSPP